MTFPARGTWIEMPYFDIAATKAVDVPRKGNVDRNTGCVSRWTMEVRTFPARGTWIEI